MKRGNPQRLEASSISGGVNVTSVEGTVVGDIHTGTQINHLHVGRRPNRPTEYPPGSIGRNLVKRNYVRYLVQRYHRFREADSSFGFGSRAAPFSYAVIFKNIERKFKAQTYFIAETQFDDLVTHLQHLIDRTILGKRNTKRGIRNYESLREFAAGSEKAD
jgi:hypothetical protein